MNEHSSYSVLGGDGIVSQLSAREALDEMQRLAAMGMPSKIFDRNGQAICDSAAAKPKSFR